MQIDEKLRAQFENTDQIDVNTPLFFVQYNKRLVYKIYLTLLCVILLSIFGIVYYHQQAKYIYMYFFVFVIVAIIIINLPSCIQRQYIFYKNRIELKSKIFKLKTLYYNEAWLSILYSTNNTKDNKYYFAFKSVKKSFGNTTININGRYLTDNENKLIKTFFETISGVEAITDDPCWRGFEINPIIKSKPTQ